MLKTINWREKAHNILLLCGEYAWTRLNSFFAIRLWSEHWSYSNHKNSSKNVSALKSTFSLHFTAITMESRTWSRSEKIFVAIQRLGVDIYEARLSLLLSVTTLAENSHICSNECIIAATVPITHFYLQLISECNNSRILSLFPQNRDDVFSEPILI